MAYWQPPKYIDSWYDYTIVPRYIEPGIHTCCIDPNHTSRLNWKMYAGCDLMISCSPTVQWTFVAYNFDHSKSYTLKTGYGNSIIQKSPFPLIDDTFYVTTTGSAHITYKHTVYNYSPDHFDYSPGHFDIVINDLELCFPLIDGKQYLESCNRL